MSALISQAFMRRAKAYEATEKLDLAIAGQGHGLPVRVDSSNAIDTPSDVKKVVEIAPTYMAAVAECARLEKAQAEAQERMKDEVVGRLL